MSNLMTGLASWLLKLGRIITRVGARLSSRFDAFNPGAFFDLTPSGDSDPDGIYERRLQHAIKSPNIKNVAVTGPYGSGKSSILLTYQQRHSEYDYLNISLGYFKDGEPGKDDSDKLIEISILQQIFYLVKHRSIPGSRFKRINQQSRIGLVLRVLLIILSLTSAAIFWKKTDVLAILRLTSFAKAHSDLLFGIQLLSIGLMLFLLFYTTLRIYGNSKLHKLSLSSGEIELAGDDASVLNKHLDEILYFFEATQYNVVIFEDLDRFENPSIFTKLREINALLNNSHQIGRKITFIYALKDEMFKENERRTKFFDFIIPVIPIISSLNSADLMIQEVTRLGLIREITPDYLRSVSLFVDDMRLLRNILNEFHLFNDQFAGAALKPINLFSIVLYKNTHPDDFALLQNDQGKVAQLLKERTGYIDRLIKEENEGIAKLQLEIDRLEALIVKDANDLRLLYIGALAVRLPPDSNGIQLEGALIRLNQLNSQEYFNQLVHQRNIRYYSYGSWYESNVSFRDLEEAVLPNVSYQEQARMLEIGKRRRLDYLRSEKERLQYKVGQVKAYSMQQLIGDLNITVGQTQTKVSDLLFYLVRNGYINEQFRFYAARFYEGTLTNNDLAFILGVKKDEPLAQDATIDNPGNIIDYLSPLDFERDAIFNFRLTTFLSNFAELHDEQWKVFLRRMGDEGDNTINYYEAYIKAANDPSKFLLALDSYWPGQCDFILNRSGYSTEKKDFHLRWLLLSYNMEQIELSDRHAGIGKYLEMKSDFLAFAVGMPVEKTKNLIRTLDIHFVQLTFNGDARDVLQFIYEGNFYAINQGMIDLMVEEFGKEQNRKPRTYDEIMRFAGQPMVDYIDSNFEVFVKDVFLTHASYREEPESGVLRILNMRSFEADLIMSVLRDARVRIRNLAGLDELLWSFAVEYQKVVIDWPNVILFFQKEGLDAALVSAINNPRTLGELIGSPLSIGDFPEEDLRRFFRNVFENRQVNDQSVPKLIQSCPFEFPEMDCANISGWRIMTLIAANKILLTPENFSNLSSLERDENLKIAILLQHMDEFMQAMEQYPISIYDVVELVRFGDVDRSISVKLLNGIREEELSEGNVDLLTDLILKLRFTPRQEILQKLLHLIQDKQLAVELLIAPESEVPFESIRHYLYEIGEQFGEILSIENRALEYTESNERLLRFLQGKGLIAAFNREEDKLFVLGNPPVGEGGGSK